MSKCWRYLFGLSVLMFCQITHADIDLVKVVKSQRQMWLLEQGKIIKQYTIALGANPVGHKQQEGDERTPEGRYILDYRNPNSGYFKSLHVSYPNKQDLANAKAKGVDAGGMIMIHGQRNGFGWAAKLTQLKDWTNGCIALNNQDMQEVWDLVKIGTPIEILP
ncbi:MAG TPA: L,D-transpeptidase family protein [Agitococcus sp.]|uniref:L,D-transpeptidase family protein n=1 Tax=uncultured Agitococcus sp. TaxID=1506599 RepID=UPI002625A550|nr:L,D-transpeptidase family protein [uncultured Agitococcus sp.]HNN27561.1 L,D-transpeptidase family protein [Agitococcus sp.]HNP02262.1 L,D-transpeptidase family protein [Agitococcus sp.]